MEDTLSKKENQIAEIKESEITSYLDMFGFSDIAENEKKQFVGICVMNGLNPFKREAYITAYGEGKYRKFAILTGYEVYIKRAEMSGRLDGWGVETTGNINNNSLKAIITIHRKDFKHPFIHEVYYAEYVQRTKNGDANKFWREKPVTMTKKVAISQGFRMCFPEILSGLPYTTDEMPTATINIDRVQKKEVKKELPILNPNSKDWDKAIDLMISKAPTFEKVLETCVITKEDFDLLVEQAQERAFEDSQNKLNEENK